MSYSSGYSPSGSLLGGLSRKPSVAAFGKGRAMSAAAGLGMERQKFDQSMAVNQMQEDSQQRMRQAGNATSRAGNETQERIQAGNLANRKAVFDTGMRYDQAAANRRRDLNFRQTLLGSLMGGY